MRWLLSVALVALTSFASAAAHDDLIIKKNASLNGLLLQMLLIPGFDEDADDASNSAEIGREICSENGGSSCYSVNSIGQGICKAGGGSGCYSVNSIGQGICKAGGGSGCYSVNSIGQGICKAGGGSGCYSVRTAKDGLSRISKSDRYWYWDQFNDAYGNLIWRCRGSQTGQFAENDKCFGQMKDDERWPNK